MLAVINKDWVFLEGVAGLWEINELPNTNYQSSAARGAKAGLLFLECLPHSHFHHSPLFLRIRNSKRPSQLQNWDNFDSVTYLCDLQTYHFRALTNYLLSHFSRQVQLHDHLVSQPVNHCVRLPRFLVRLRLAALLRTCRPNQFHSSLLVCDSVPCLLLQSYQSSEAGKIVWDGSPGRSLSTEPV